jgi:8-oxo-dGTP pyrophosphatase MutT (NUDIX family)
VSEEQVIVVDRENRVTGSTPRSRMRAGRLPHRASFVFVFRSSGKLVAQQRTATKDVYPGYLDLAAGGVVLAGESYDESAARELAEELGIRGVPLDPHFEFWFEDDFVRVWGKAYSCVWDGPLALQPEEVAAVQEMAPETILAGEADAPFTPDSLAAFRRLMPLRSPSGG